MRIAIVGQRDFGKAVLDAFLARRDTVLGVFCAPEKPGSPADPLRLAAEQGNIPVFQFPSLKTEEAREALRGLGADLGVMARDARRMRGDGPVVFAQCTHGVGIAEVVDAVVAARAAALAAIRLERDATRPVPGRDALR